LHIAWQRLIWGRAICTILLGRERHQRETVLLEAVVTDSVEPSERLAALRVLFKRGQESVIAKQFT
jgi:hypothetical protein